MGINNQYRIRLDYEIAHDRYVLNVERLTSKYEKELVSCFYPLHQFSDIFCGESSRSRAYIYMRSDKNIKEVYSIVRENIRLIFQMMYHLPQVEAGKQLKQLFNTPFARILTHVAVKYRL